MRMLGPEAGNNGEPPCGEVTRVPHWTTACMRIARSYRLLYSCLTDGLECILGWGARRGGSVAKKRKISLQEAAERLTAITESHLKTLPEEEQELRVAMFERSALTLQRDRRDKLPKPRRTAGSHTRASGRR